MPRLRQRSGQQLIDFLKTLGFVIVRQRGSHVRLERVLPGGNRRSMTVPLHKELGRKTLREIYRQVIQIIPEEEARPGFYA